MAARTITSSSGDLAREAEREISEAANDVPVRIEPDDIQQSGVVGGAVSLPGRPSTPTVYPGIRYNLAARPDVEYVAGGLFEASLAYARSLPQYIDDLTARHGIDLYEQMQRDAQVAGDINFLKLSVLANGLSLTPAIEDPAPGWRQAKKALEFCQINIDELDTPMVPWLHQIMDALATGNIVSEMVYRRDRERLMLYRLKPKPRNVYAFVVDNRQNMVGLLGALAGRARTVIVNASILDPQLVPNLIPRHKFAIYAFNPVNSNPRGSSLLYPAYDPWWRKQQHLISRMRYLARFGSPSIIGTTGESQNETPVYDANGQVVIDHSTGRPLFQSPADSLARAIQGFQNGSVLVAPAGSTIEKIEASGTGEAFRDAIDYEDGQISKSILSQTLTTNEGKHESRAAAKTAKSGTDLIVDYVEQTLSTMIRREVLAPLLEANFGSEFARRFTPKVTLSKVEEVDFAPMATGVASLVTAGYIAASQQNGIDAKLGLPKRTEGDLPLVGDDDPNDGPENL
jgi:hypothetical protein